MSWPQGLQKQTYRLNMGMGLEGKTDPKVMGSGKMLVLQNAKFVVGNRINKRDGFAAVGSADAINTINRIDRYGLNPIGWGTSAAGRSFFSYLQSLNSYAGGMALSTISPGTDFVTTSAVTVANNNTQPLSDSTSMNGYTIQAWYETTAATVYYRIIQESNQSVVQSGQLAAFVPTTDCVRTCYLNSQYLIASCHVTASSQVYMVSAYIGGGSIALASTTIASVPTASPSFDLMNGGLSGAVLMAYQSSATALQFLSLNAANFLTITPVAYTQAVTITTYGLPSMNPGTLSVTSGCLFSDFNSRINFLPVSNNAGVLIGTPTISATNDTTVRVITGQKCSNNTYRAFVTSNTSAALPQTLCETTPYTINASNTFTAWPKILGQAIHSKPIYVDDNNVYFWTLFPSLAQGQYVLFNHRFSSFANNYSSSPAARLLFGQAMGPAQGTIPTQAVAPGSYATNRWKCAATTIGQQYSTAAGLQQLPCFSTIDMDYTFANAYHISALNNQTVIAGGMNLLYDGNSLTELGFLMYPEGYTASVTTTGGLMGAGLYQYICTYEWTDQGGQLHRSETGIPLSVTTTGATAGVTLTVPCLRTTLRNPWPSVFGAIQAPNIAVYRTTVSANPQIFYRVATVASSALSQSVTVSDTAADTVITANQFIYTQGGVSDNFTVDGTTVICALPDRLVAADPNNNGIVHVGIQYTPTVGLAFHPTVQMLFPTADGPFTNFQYMDTTFVAFKARSIYAVSGVGPTPNGQNNGFSQPQLITPEIGCDNPHAATICPEGIIFKSAKGYFILGRDLSFDPATNYVGAAVEAYNSLSCLRAVTLTDLNECRFLLSDKQTILVYNYFFKQWSTIQTSANDMTVALDGSLYTANATPSFGGLVAKQTIGTFTDATLSASPTGYPFKITTGWIALNQLQGCMRIYRVRFLGDFKSTHTLQVEFAYDYEGGDSPTFAETHTITSANITSGSSAWQCEAFPLRQKCQSICLRITDPSPTGESFDLTDVELEVGVQPGRRFPLSSLKGF